MPGASVPVSERQSGSAFGQLALLRLLSAPGHASGCPKRWLASADPPLGPSWPATTGLAFDIVACARWGALKVRVEQDEGARRGGYGGARAAALVPGVDECGATPCPRQGPERVSSRPACVGPSAMSLGFEPCVAY